MMLKFGVMFRVKSSIRGND